MFQFGIVDAFNKKLSTKNNEVLFDNDTELSLRKNSEHTYKNHFTRYFFFNNEI